MIEYRRLLIPVVVFILARPLCLRAQEQHDTADVRTLSINSHLRARVAPDSAVVDGYLRAHRGDTLFVAPCRQCADTRTVTFDRTYELAVARRTIKGRTVLMHGIIGTVAGGVLGLAAGSIIAHHEIKSCGSDDICGLSYLYIPFGAAVGTGAGLLIGVVSGILAKETSWTPVVWRP